MAWTLSSYASIVFNDAPVWYLPTGLTISIWAKPSGGAGPLLEKYGGPYEWTFGYANSTVYAWCYDDTTSSSIGRAGANGYDPLQWTHLTFSFNGGTSYTDTTLYANGIYAGGAAFITNYPGPFASIRDTTKNVVHGGSSSGLGGPLIGSFAELCVHNVCLTQQEIKQEMRYPGSVKRGLILYIPGSTNRLDCSGQGINSTTDTASNYTGIYLPPIIGRNEILV